METIETITAKLRLLPADRLPEVAEFVDSLLAQLPEPDEEEAEAILNETFGIWPNEVDGIEYENRMRQQWQRRG